MHTQELRVGVYICHCGQNIAGKVDVEEVARFAGTLEHVAIARHYQFMCSDQGQDMIIADVVNLGLNRVVVASCSPRMHLPTFARACARAGLNPYLLQMTNIREGSAWVSMDGKQATGKAMSLVSAAVSRVQRHRSLSTRKIDVQKSVLVIGGGIAGMQAALTAAGSGYPVFLVEKSPSLGGQMAKLDKTFPTLDCAACIGTPKMVEVAQNPDITLLTYSEVKEISGFVGNYTVTVLKKPRYVLHEECTGCGECAKVCPVLVPSEWNEGLGERTAIYRSFPQAVPGTFCIDKKDRAPCTLACPAGANVQGYVQLIGQGKYDEAMRVIRERLPLPGVLGRVCPHPCENSCRRSQVDSPLTIRALKRFVADNTQVGPAPAPDKSREEKVAVIGSGPAGLASACFLRQKGFRVTMFEAGEHLGGMLRTGIPDFRLPPEILDREIDMILQLGVEVRTNTSFGRDITLDSLRNEGFSAAFLAIGAQGGTGMGLDGEDCRGVIDAVSFLKSVNLKQHMDVGREVLVIGGGNVALDAARVALRLGYREVTVLYRRSAGEMPAYPEEIQEARKEGVKFSYLTQPCRLILENNCVSGLECLNTRLGEPDASGRRRPETVQGSEHAYRADTIITAVGQKILAPWAEQEPDLKWTGRGTIQVDHETQQTSIPWVFAAGDAVSGPATVVEAIGSARRAAEAISRYLDGLELKTGDSQAASQEKEWNPVPDDLHPLQRAVPEQLDPREALQGFTEVEKPMPDETARQEALRCLNCGVCSECMECVSACERGAIDHNMQPEETRIQVGSIILATGFELFNPEPLSQYGFGRFREVYTSLQFERLNNATGPTQGKIQTKEGKNPDRVAIIHCVGSRDKNHKPYCSRVCCMYSMKFAHLIREKTGAEVYSFYIDMRTPGKNYEEFYNRIQAEGIRLIRGRVAEVTDITDNPEDTGRLMVVAENTLSGKVLRIPVDMVILSPAMVPARGSEITARLAGVSADSHGWLTEQHPKLAPVSTQASGVFVAGCCQGPKDIPDTVAQASAAAGEASALLARGWVSTLAERAVIDQDICSGCALCTQVCPYAAVSIQPEDRYAQVNEALCRGCGSCSATCPSGAAVVQQFAPEQIFSEIFGLLHEPGQKEEEHEQQY